MAFAGADLAFEIDRQGLILFALGAGEQISGRPAETLIGQDWTLLVADEEKALLASLLNLSRPGDRHGPLRVALAPKGGAQLTRFAALATFELPQNQGRLSCALTVGAPLTLDAAPHGSNGLIKREDFETAAVQLMSDLRKIGAPAQIELLELDGFNAILSTLDNASALQRKQRLAAALRAASTAGLGAAEVGPDRFAMLRAPSTPPERLADRLEAICGDDVKVTRAEIALGGGSPKQVLKAMRYALDRCLEASPDEVSISLHALLTTTNRQAAHFRSILATRNFTLGFQPIIDLKSRALHHFEALARFGDAVSPGDTIRLAEELDMIVDFDLAVLQIVVDKLMAASDTSKIAMNISALSLMAPRFLDIIFDSKGFSAGLRPRLLLEITETQMIRDLPLANATLSKLRSLGHLICLDDFGVGAASLDYLCQLDVDFVKIDGRFIKNLADRPKDRQVVKHLVALCRDLGVSTIAEVVETAKEASAATDLGIDLGQGWLFGRPQKDMSWRPPATSSPAPAKRRGSRTQWG